MLAGGKITDVGMPCPINAHTFGVFPVIFVKQGQQCLFDIGFPGDGILDDFCRDEAIRVHVSFVGGLRFLLLTSSLF